VVAALPLAIAGATGRLRDRAIDIGLTCIVLVGALYLAILARAIDPYYAPTPIRYWERSGDPAHRIATLAGSPLRGRVLPFLSVNGGQPDQHCTPSDASLPARPASVCWQP
jgi:hypothetical protein